MFLVPKGSSCRVVREGGEKTISHTTRHENIFEKYEVVADPLFNLAPSVGNLYGFKRDGWTLWVDADKVQYL